jgi:hypothetical protein
LQTKQQAQHILNITQVDLSTTEEVPLDAEASELLNSGVKIA